MPKNYKKLVIFIVIFIFLITAKTYGQSMEVSPDTLKFLTEEDCIYGKNITIKNIDTLDVIINDFVLTGGPYEISYVELPYVLVPDDSIIVNVIPVFPIKYITRDLETDTLFVVANIDTSKVILIFNTDLYNAIDSGGGINLPKTHLLQNYPNPFNSNTTIEYYIDKNLKIKLKIYNIKGQLIKTLVNQFNNSGQKSVVWNGRDDTGRPVSVGTYIYKLETNFTIKARKMFLINNSK